MLAETFNNQGILFEKQGRLDDALRYYRQAVETNPAFPEAHVNLASILARQGQTDEARAHYEEAVRLRPAFPEARNNLGALYARLGKFAEAEAEYRLAIETKPDYPDPFNNLANTLAAQGRFAEAEECFREALRLKPDYVEAHVNLAMARLVQGDFEGGWREYEWRWRGSESFRRNFRQPLWDGSPLGGRTILLHAEQGFGDTLQFIRYVPLVQARGGRVVVECQKPLIDLLATCPGVAQVVDREAILPDFDVYAPLLSLPGIFHTTLATIPAEVPYLKPDAETVRRWQRELEGFPGFKIGIAWQGNPSHRRDHFRSFPLALFEPLARIPGVYLFSLQKGPGAEQLDALGGRFPVTDLGRQLDGSSRSFLEGAALVQNLDLVICADTALAHLAGALAKPVWVALPFPPDWRWLLEREDSPWYPTLRLFRQTTPGDWQDVFARITEALKQQLATHPEAPKRTLAGSPGELLERIAALEVRRTRATTDAERRQFSAELAALEEACKGGLEPSRELTRLRRELLSVREQLHQVEDQFRAWVAGNVFGTNAMELARTLLSLTERSTALRQEMDRLLEDESRRD
jgi:Flp pilus assembly protein TadD